MEFGRNGHRRADDEAVIRLHREPGQGRKATLTRCQGDVLKAANRIRLEKKKEENISRAPTRLRRPTSKYGESNSEKSKKVCDQIY